MTYWSTYWKAHWRTHGYSGLWGPKGDSWRVFRSTFFLVAVPIFLHWCASSEFLGFHCICAVLVPHDLFCLRSHQGIIVLSSEIWGRGGVGYGVGGYGARCAYVSGISGQGRGCGGGTCIYWFFFRTTFLLELIPSTGCVCWVLL